MPAYVKRVSISRASVDFGRRIEITKFEVKDSSKLEITVGIPESAQPGSRALTITNPDCSTATLAGAVNIVTGDG